MGTVKQLCIISKAGSWDIIEVEPLNKYRFIMFIVNNTAAVKYPPTIVPMSIFSTYTSAAQPLVLFAEGVTCFAIYQDAQHIGLITADNTRSIRAYVIK